MCYDPAPVERWSLFLAALGIAMFLEGLPYFISPAAVRGWLRTLERTGDTALRTMGLVLMIAGLVVAWLATH